MIIGRELVATTLSITTIRKMTFGILAHSLRAGLHYSDYRYKVFEAQEIIFSVKKALA
jgi:hypothetical protein